jgi:hypothetical protein
MNSIIFKKSVLLYSMMALVLLVSSCSSDQEEYTGAGNVVPTSPQITITPEVSNLSLVEDDSSYSYTVALSTVQLVDVVVKISQVDGDATMGEDFTIDNSLVISAGSTSATGTITILSDELAEETETVTIQVGDNTTANASITPETMTFTILNLSEGDLVIDLEWAQAVSVTDNYGEEADPLDVGDLRLLLTDTNFGTLLSVDTGDFEQLIVPENGPDGTYYIVADYFSATDVITNLNLDLTINQFGKINDANHKFNDVMSTANVCPEAYYVLASVVKSGTDYTVTRVAEANTMDLNNYVGTWTGGGAWYQYFGYDTEVETTIDANGDLWMTGITFNWCQGWWGEPILSSAPVKVNVDTATGEFSIDEQYHYTTSYGDYNVKATGSFTFVCTATPEFVMLPVLVFEGGDIDGTAWGIPFDEYGVID